MGGKAWRLFAVFMFAMLLASCFVCWLFCCCRSHYLPSLLLLLFSFSFSFSVWLLLSLLCISLKAKGQPVVVIVRCVLIGGDRGRALSATQKGGAARI